MDEDSQRFRAWVATLDRGVVARLAGVIHAHMGGDPPQLLTRGLGNWGFSDEVVLHMADRFDFESIRASVQPAAVATMFTGMCSPPRPTPPSAAPPTHCSPAMAPGPFGGVGLMCQLAGVFSSVGLGGGLLDRQAAVWRRDTVPGSVGGARRARPAASVAPSPEARSWASLVTPRPCSAWRGRNGEPGIRGFLGSVVGPNPRFAAPHPHRPPPDPTQRGSDAVCWYSAVVLGRPDPVGAPAVACAVRWGGSLEEGPLKPFSGRSETSPF